MHQFGGLKKSRKKDQTIITPEMEEKCSTTTILEKTIELNTTVNRTGLAFGVSDDRGAEVLRKLIAVAKVYPRYSVIAESFLNCSDRFTEMERLFGLFLLGKAKGMATMLVRCNLKVKFNATSMNLEQKLLSLLTKDVVVEDPLLNQLLKEGKDGR